MANPEREGGKSIMNQRQKDNFLITTPGKVILHGEHAVVYNRPAVAAAIGLGTSLRFIYPKCKKVEKGEEERDKEITPGDAPKPAVNMIEIELESLQANFTLPIDTFNTFLCNYRTKYSNVPLNGGKLLEAVREEFAQNDDMMKECGWSKSPTTMQMQIQNAYIAIYYMLAGAVLSSPKQREEGVADRIELSQMKLQEGFMISINTQLNIGAGLGSSASFGVALAAAFLIYAGHFDLKTYMEAKHLSLISEWAFESERIMHGVPSGVDNTVCTYGGILRFVKGEEFRRLTLKHPLNILLVDSKVKRSSADMVAKVRHLKETFPNIIDAIWNACEAVVNDAIPLYESYGSRRDDSEKFEKLERLFQINNDLLKAIGVSHPKLEHIFSIAFQRGFFSKLTGAGGGGYVIVILPENCKSNEVFYKLLEELQAAGYGVSVTTAGGDGIRINPID